MKLSKKDVVIIIIEMIIIFLTLFMSALFL